MAAESSRFSPSVDSYAGCLISLISKSEIRYERIHVNINTAESSIEMDIFTNLVAEAIKAAFNEEFGDEYQLSSLLNNFFLGYLGYENWDELKAAFRTSPLFRFDWFVKSCTTQELARRCDALVRLVEKENQEFDERERQARKEKKLAKVFLRIERLICSQKF